MPSALIKLKPGVVMLLIISDGRCGLIDCLAFYFMRRLELVDQWKWVGYCFCSFLWPLHDSLATENDCSDNDGACKLF